MATEQPAHLLGAQDVGQRARMVEADQPAGEIGPVDRMDEEEAQGRDDGIHRRHPEADLLLRDLETAQVVDGRRVGRAPQERRQTPDITKVVALCLTRETDAGSCRRRGAGAASPRQRRERQGWFHSDEGSHDRPPRPGDAQSAQGARLNPQTSKLPPIPRKRVRSFHPNRS